MKIKQAIYRQYTLYADALRQVPKRKANIIIISCRTVFPRPPPLFSISTFESFACGIVDVSPEYQYYYYFCFIFHALVVTEKRYCVTVRSTDRPTDRRCNYNIATTAAAASICWMNRLSCGVSHFVCVYLSRSSILAYIFLSFSLTVFI